MPLTGERRSVEVSHRNRVAEHRGVLTEISSGQVTAKPAQGLPEQLHEAIVAWT
jgi:hypothetical protein